MCYLFLRLRCVYDENVSTLKGLASMVSSMDKDNPIVQLKLTAIMPAKTLVGGDVNLSIAI